VSHTVSSAWYADFFTELPNEFWRRVVPPEATAAEVDFLEEHLGLRPGARVVDVPCGSGRHTLALAARGHRVTGLDISAEAIGHARRAAEAAGLDVTLVRAEMREVAHHGTFDAAICLGNSFGYLDAAGTRAFARALAAAVRPGGGLVVDFNLAAESVLPGHTGGPRTLEVGDITAVTTSEYDVDRSCIRSHYRFRRGPGGAGGTEEVAVTALHHVYTSAHLGEILTDAGFTDVARFAGPDGAPYVLGAPRLLLTARRGRPR
jgi:SAM-dependent methyltransferase